MTNKKTKIFIVDDHFMFLEGLQSLLGGEQTFDIIGVGSNGKEAIDFLDNHSADIVITDISMPGVDGFELVKEIQKRWPAISILVLSMHSEPAIISKLIQEHINGYLLKNAEKEELLKAIRLLAQGENYFSEDVKRIYMENSFNKKKDDYQPVLSRREIEVLKLIVEEYTAKEIAEVLCISQHTVESHRKNIFSKLNVKNVAGVVKYALENNLIGD
jgi:DNA-binding NarL/FixJ family response regulator